jgi:hypothetical protein
MSHLSKSMLVEVTSHASLGACKTVMSRLLHDCLLLGLGDDHQQPDTRYHTLTVQQVHNLYHTKCFVIYDGARWSSGRCAQRAIAEAKQWMGDQNLLSRAPPFFGRHVKLLVSAAFAVVSTHQLALGVVGYNPFSLCVVHKEGLIGQLIQLRYVYIHIYV